MAAPGAPGPPACFVCTPARSCDNGTVRQYLIVNLCVVAALGVGALGLFMAWAPQTTFFACLGSLVLGLAVARLLDFISTRKGAEQPAQKDVR